MPHTKYELTAEVVNKNMRMNQCLDEAEKNVNVDVYNMEVNINKHVLMVHTRILYTKIVKDKHNMEMKRLKREERAANFRDCQELYTMSISHAKTIARKDECWERFQKNIGEIVKKIPFAAEDTSDNDDDYEEDICEEDLGDDEGYDGEEKEEGEEEQGPYCIPLSDCS
jgi:hypothetical protein